MLAESNTLLTSNTLMWSIPLAAVVLTFVTAIVKILAENWQRAREAEIEGALKQDMLNRGMSADEIAKVIAASPGRPHQDDSKKMP